MVQKRHPHNCRWIVGALTRHEPLPFVHAVLACEREVRVAGLDAPPPWHELTQEVLVDVDNESEPNQPHVDGKRRRLELLTTSSSPRSFGQLCQGRSEP